MECTGSSRCAAAGCSGGECTSAICPAAPTACTGLVAVDEGTLSIKRLGPVKVSDCIPGGDIGRDTTYSEDQTETRKRSLDLAWSSCSTVDVNLSDTFKVDVAATVTSKSTPSLKGSIVPGAYGVFYRQTVQTLRSASLWDGNVFVGLAVLTDWSFSPEFQSGTHCTPPSALSQSLQTVQQCATSSQYCPPCP